MIARERTPVSLSPRLVEYVNESPERRSTRPELPFRAPAKDLETL